MRITTEAKAETRERILEAAAKMFEGHPHFTIFPCDCVDVMPLLSGPPPDA